MSFADLVKGKTDQLHRGMKRDKKPPQRELITMASSSASASAAAAAIASAPVKNEIEKPPTGPRGSLTPAKRLKPSITNKNSSELIALIGPGGQLFKVHKVFACHYSPLLNSYCSRKTADPDPRYTLDQHSSTTLAFLVQWFYTQEIELTQMEGTEYNLTETRALVGLWTCAERLQIPRLQNHVIEKLDAMQQKFNITVVGVLQQIWDDTRSDSALRLYFIDRCVSSLQPHYYLGDHAERTFTKRILLDVIAALAKTTSKADAEKCKPTKHLSKYYVSEK